MPNKSTTVTFKVTDVLLVLITGLGIGWLIGLSVSPVLHIIVGSVIAVIAGAVGAMVGLQQQSEHTSNSHSEAQSKWGRRLHITPINPLPLTMLVIGLGIGSSGGIYARTNGLLGPNPQTFARQWTGTGLDEKEIQKRLFNQLYPQTLPEGSQKEETNQTGTALEITNQASGTNGENNTNEMSSSKVAGNRQRVSNASTASTHSTQAPETSKQLTAGLYTLTVEECDPLILKHGAELRTLLRALNRPDITNLVDKCKDDTCVDAVKDLVCPRKR